MDFKKYPAFSATICVLGLAFLAGAGLAGYRYYEYTQKKSSLERNEKSLKSLTAPGIVAPTPENVRIAQENLEEITKDEKALFENLKGKFPEVKDERLENEPAEVKAVLSGLSEKFVQATTQPLDGTNLSSKFKETAGRLEKAIASKGARILKKTDFGFGFKRYVDTGASPANNLPELAIENLTIHYLLGQLLVSKDPKELLVIQEIKREPVEVRQSGGIRGKVEEDEYTPLPNETLRREGVAQTLYFRLKFTSNTALFRKFINKIRASDAPIFIRGVEVAKASEAALHIPEEHLSEQPAPDAGATAPHLPEVAAVAAVATPDAPVPDAPFPAAEDAQAAVIVKSDPCEFTVSFEYILPVPLPTPETDAQNANK